MLRTFDGYTTGIVTGWTEEKTGEDNSLFYYYYGPDFVLGGTVPVDEIPADCLRDFMLPSTYDSVLKNLISFSGGKIISKEELTICNHPAVRAVIDMSGLLYETVMRYEPESNGIFQFGYFQLSGDDSKRKTVMDTAINHMGYDAAQ